MATLSVRFRVDFGDACAIGPGKISLLESIQRGGSLSQAARELRMSYRRAWLLLDSLNRSFRRPVARLSKGGKGGGGATLTSFGETLVDAYRLLERDLGHRASSVMGLVAREVVRLAPATVQRRPLKKHPPRNRRASHRRARRPGA